MSPVGTVTVPLGLTVAPVPAADLVVPEPAQIVQVMSDKR